MPTKLTVMKPSLFCAGETGSIAIFGQYKKAGFTGATGYSSDPDVIQGYTGATGRTGLTGRNAWTEGWYAAVDALNAPTIQDMNAFFYVTMYNICYLFQEGIGHYMATKEYHKGSFVKNSTLTNGSTGSSGAIGTGATGCMFVQIGVTGETGNALSATNWQVYYPNKVTTIGYNYETAYDDYIINWSLAATTASQRTVELTSDAAIGRQIIICVTADTKDGTSNPYTLGVIVTSGGNTISGDPIPQGGCAEYVNMGTSGWRRVSFKAVQWN